MLTPPCHPPCPRTPPPMQLLFVAQIETLAAAAWEPAAGTAGGLISLIDLLCGGSAGVHLQPNASHQSPNPTPTPSDWCRWFCQVLWLDVHF